MGMLSDVDEVLDLASDTKRQGHSASTSMLYAFATDKWGNKPVAQAFAEAENNATTYNLEANLAEKYSSQSENLPQGVVEGFISPKEAVGLQSQIQSDLEEGGLTTELGASAINPENPSYEKMVNHVQEWRHRNSAETDWKDYAKSVIPLRTQALMMNVFGSPDADKLKSISDTFNASDDDTKEKIVKELIRRFDKVPGYELEKDTMISGLLQGFSKQDGRTTNVIAGIDLFDVVGVAGGLGHIVRSGSVSSTLQRGGLVEDAGDAAAAAIQNPAIAKRNGENTNELISNIITNDRIDDSLGTQTAASLNNGKQIITDVQKYNNEMVARITATMDDTIKSENYDVSVFKEMDIDPEDGVSPLKQRFLDEIQQSHIVFAKEGVAPVPTAKIVSVDAHDGTAVVQYTLKGNFKGTKVNKDGSLSKRGETNNNIALDETRTVSLGSNVHSTMEDLASDVSRTQHFLASPNYKFETLNGTTVNRMVENAGLDLRSSDRIVTRMLTEYTSLLKEAGISGKNAKRANFEKALKDLDNKDELASVDHLLDHYKFTEKEVKAYYGIHRLSDLANDMEIHARYRKAFLAGVKTVKIGKTKYTGKSYSTIARAMDDLKEAQYVSSRGDLLTSRIYDASTHRYVNIPTGDHNSSVLDGKKIVLLDDDVVAKFDGGSSKNTRLMLVPESDISEITKEALKTFQRQSYVPVYRPNANYFVKEKTVRNVDGIPMEYERTAASFDNKIDAEKYHKDRIKKFENGELKDVVSIDKKVLYDRESKLSTGSDQRYTSSKARATKHEIEWMGVSDSSRLNPIEAIGRNLSIVGNNYATNEWKSSILTKWKNSVAKLKHNGNLNNPVDVSTPEGRNLEEQRVYIKSKFGIPSDETMAWEGFTRRVADYMDLMPTGSNSTALSRAIRRAGDHDPYSYIKYTVYQTMLGMFNPSQLFVQAQNMSFVMSAFPGMTMSVMKKSLGLKWFMDLDDASLSVLLKQGKIKEETLDIIQQFRRANLHQVNNNADIELALQGFGGTAGRMKKLLESGTIFYRQGELSSRSVLYPVARKKYMRDNNILSWKDLDEADHRRIIEEFDNLSFNLNSNNKAYFQEGGLSIPTQFWHVQTKFIETLRGKNFTPAEKVRLLVGQFVLYGAAGVPGFYALGDFLQKRDPDGSGKILGFDSDTVRGGLVNLTFSEATGSDVQLAQRGALAYGLEGYYRGLFRDDNKAIWQKMMGASGELFRRGSYAWNISRAFGEVSDDQVNEPDLFELVLAFGSISSSISNANSAFDMAALGHYRDKYSGRINFRDPTLTEIWAKGLGFTPTRDANTWENAMQLREYQKWKTSKVNAFFQVMASKHIDPTEESGMKWLAKMIPTYAKLFGGKNPNDVAEIQKSILRKIKRLKGKSKEEAVISSMAKRAGTSSFREYNPEEEDK